MNNLKLKVINFLNMGLNPAVIGFYDDGLFYLFDKLLKGKQASTGYDPTYSFIHISLSYFDNLNTSVVESEINNDLTRDVYPGNTVFETFQNNVETVCVIDDLAYLKQPNKAIEIADNLAKKYRGNLKFVFLIEDPLFLNKIKSLVNPNSILYDGIIYQEIGNEWHRNTLLQVLEAQFKQKIPQTKLEGILKSTGSHFGATKRAFQDEILNTDSFKRYSNLLLENFSDENLNALKKFLKNKELTETENSVVDAYKKVGLIDVDSLKIKILEDIILNQVIKNKVTLNSENKLTGLDLNLLNKTERKILEVLMLSSDIITREEMGKIIWSDKFLEKYSDWAIDQRIARLRRKLIDLGFNVDVRTIYGEGYTLEKIEYRN